MNRFRSLRLSTALFIFSAVISEAASLKGSFVKAPSSPAIFLFGVLGDLVYKVDSVKLKGDKFQFKAKGSSFSTGLYRVGLSPEASAPVVLSTEDVEVVLDVNNWDKAVYKNSVENRLFAAFRDLNAGTNSAMRVLEGKYKLLVANSQNDKTAFDAGMNRLRTQADSLLRNQQAQLAKLQAENPNAFFSQVIRLSQVEPAISPETYFSNADLENEGLLHTDVWQQRVSNYLQKFGEGDPDKWVILCDQLVLLTKPNTPAREVVYRAIANATKPLEQSGITYSYEAAKKYDTEFKTARSAAFLKSFPPGPPSVGDQAPDIALADSLGKILKLSSLRGKVVLIDFWASWCGPCRHENPTVVKAYQKYEPKGFTVFSVSLDQNRDKWLAAIKKDGLIWSNHVSDLKGWQSEGAALYKVSGIPATFLLDKEGKIVAKNLRGPALENKLKELLGP